MTATEDVTCDISKRSTATPLQCNLIESMANSITEVRLLTVLLCGP